MALFNRRKQNTEVLPEEVREYYQSERRERAGLAWLLAIGTLLVTFLIAAVLFFGGRWAYRTVFDNDNKDDVASEEQKGLRIDEKGNVIGGDTKPADTGKPGQSTGTSSTSTSTPSSTPSTTPKPIPTTTPNTGPTELVNTGPGDE